MTDSLLSPVEWS